MTTYFTRIEALKDILETLENGYEGYLFELHDEVFNTDYYIIGRYEAEKALEDYGVFKAIREIRDYEEFSFRERYTDLSEPESVANMLYYIVGNEIINEIVNSNNSLSDEWNSIVSDETRQLLLSIVDNELHS